MVFIFIALLLWGESCGEEKRVVMEKVEGLFQILQIKIPGLARYFNVNNRQ
jgi:hypothetical protein